MSKCSLSAFGEVQPKAKDILCHAWNTKPVPNWKWILWRDDASAADHIFTNQVIFTQSRTRQTWSDHAIWTRVNEGDDLCEAGQHLHTKLFAYKDVCTLGIYSPYVNISGWLSPCKNRHLTQTSMQIYRDWPRSIQKAPTCGNCNLLGDLPKEINVFSCSFEPMQEIYEISPSF